jgi:DNA-binding IclR family transcriptional regulator
MVGHRDTVLGKAVMILRSFSAEDRSLPLNVLVRRTGLHKATVHRLCTALVEHKLLDKSGDGYRLSGGLFELGMRASVERSLLEMAMPFLLDLAERTRETVHLGVREGHEVVYVAKVGGHRQVRSPSRVGGRMPLHCTAIGKVLLAHSDEQVQDAFLATRLTKRTPRTVVGPGLLRDQLESAVTTGVAFEREESQLGITCVAAVVLGADDAPLAAISLAGPTSRFRPEAHVVTLRSAAALLSVALGRREARTQ